MSGWLLVLGRCSEVRRTGKSACATERRRRSRARGKNWWLCCGVLRAQAEAYATEKRRTLARERQELAIVLERYVAQAGMPVLLKPVATILFCGLIFFRVADHLLLEGVL
jgi:hypothetical protein